MNDLNQRFSDLREGLDRAPAHFYRETWIIPQIEPALKWCNGL